MFEIPRSLVYTIGFICPLVKFKAQVIILKTELALELVILVKYNNIWKENNK